MLDRKAPSGTLSINRGAPVARSTTVSLSLHASDDSSGVTHVRVSNDRRRWLTLAHRSSLTWSLSNSRYGGSGENGRRAVYAQWRDRTGKWSGVGTDIIVLDTGLEESRFLALINGYRARKGLPSLGLSPRLTRAAAWMSADVGAHRYFAHRDSRGRDPFQRMAAFGYTYNTAKGENLAAGYLSARTAFDSWLKSPGHKRNLDNPKYRAIGISARYTTGSPYGWYWTTDFGGYRDR